jgi:hypothetical protein
MDIYNKHIHVGCVAMKVAALSAGPYAYIISVLGGTLPEPDTYFTLLWMYILGTVICGTVIALINRIGDNVPLCKNVKPFTGHYWVEYLVNIFYTMTVTTLLAHVSGPEQPFIVVAVVVTIRLQQTLSSSKITNPFNGLIAILVIVAQVVIWSDGSQRSLAENEGVDSCILKGRSRNNMHWIVVMILCVMVGMATQAHATRIVVTSLTDIFKQNTNNNWLLLSTWGIHIISVSVITFMVQQTPFLTHICGTMNNGEFQHVIGFVLTITTLLISTMPVTKTHVHGIMTGDTAGVCAALLITLRYPASGTVSIIAIYASYMILISVVLPVYIAFNKAKSTKTVRH